MPRKYEIIFTVAVDVVNKPRRRYGRRQGEGGGGGKLTSYLLSRVAARRY